MLLGIYMSGNLVREYRKDGKTSEILPALFAEILESYEIKRICYARGPGNFSAIKLTHIFLQTLQITLGVELYAAKSFAFTTDKFINAYGKIHFFKESGEIKTIALDTKREAEFALPNALNIADFNEACAPLYILPAV